MQPSKRQQTPLPLRLAFCAYILLHLAAFLAVKCVRDALSSADNASALERSVVALVADAHQSVGPHVTVADGAFAVAPFAQPANR